MRLRPLDVSGDVMPVLQTSEMVKDSYAVAQLIHDSLDLFVGEWWENESWGNKIINMLKEERITDANANSLSVYLSDYVRETEGVKEVTDVKYSVVDRVFTWECTVLTEYGSVAVAYEI